MMRVASLTFVAVLLAAYASQSRASAEDVDLKFLRNGVNEISAPGVPGTLCVFGKEAFVIVTGNTNGAAQEPVVAAARLGKGRVVAFGHDGYFGKEALETADTGQLMENAIRWAARNAPPRVGVLGQAALMTFCRSHGIAAQALRGLDPASRLSDLNVLCLHPSSIATAADLTAVSEFVRAGGGVILADTGWGWLQLHPGKTLTADHTGNRLLASAGIVWGDGFLNRTARLGFAAGKAPSEFTHAARALEAVEACTRGEKQLTKEEMAQAVSVVIDAARILPPGDEILRPRLRWLQAEHTAEAIPTAEKPLTEGQPLARLVLALQLQEMNSLIPEQVRAHPAANHFPGEVPANAPRVIRTIEIDTKIPGWHSTGLYAAPGEVIRVSVPRSVAGKGLTVRIGAHSDSLWSSNSWRRCPEICRRDALTKPMTLTASSFGGLIYIEAPEGCSLGEITTEISGAVEAPHFLLSKTDPTQWRASLRSRPAPWAELETRKVILTVPSTVVRGLDDPVSLMQMWDRVLDACAQLAGIPLDRVRPERYVTDVQISAGYMHSGYPIMTFLDVAPVLVDRARILTNGHGGVWGFFHEMGHNHQSADWTFEGTGEVTENLFSLYVMEKVCGIKEGGHPAIVKEAREKRMKEYLATGADFSKWKSDPFLALTMYMQLQEAFGWEAYQQVFKEYRALPSAEHPKSDDEKRDQWMVRFSRAVGRNLGPFFQRWGVPTSEKARSSVSDLPVWMPPGLPLPGG